jgi:universal stress protein A
MRLNIKCILHPTDFSTHSEGAFQVACALARDYDARLVVLHVAPSPVMGNAGALLIPPDPEVYRQEYEGQLRQLQPPDPKIRVEHRLELGETVTKILEVVQECHCDMIVMGTHGRTGIGRLLMGSVAEKIVRNSVCPVLTVKTPMSDSNPASEPPPVLPISVDRESS